MAIGIVQRFDAARGYGFIAPSDGVELILVARPAVERLGRRTLAAGERVTFDICGDYGRIEAVGLMLMPPRPAA